MKKALPVISGFEEFKAPGVSYHNYNEEQDLKRNQFQNHEQDPSAISVFPNRPRESFQKRNNSCHKIF